MRRLFGLTALTLGLVLPVLGQDTKEEKKTTSTKEAKPKFTRKLPGIIRTDGEKGLMFQPGGRGEWVELKTAEELKVRVPQPPQQFDEKGKPKKYTSKELKELRGTSGLPGYTGDFGDLKSNQIVEVWLLDPKKSTKKKKDDEDAGETKPVATVIVIIRDAQR